MPSPHEIEQAIMQAAKRRRERSNSVQVRELGQLQLLLVYTRASRAVVEGRLKREIGAGWERVIPLLDEVNLLAMGRQVGDAFPWLPVLRLVLAFRAVDDGPRWRDAEIHIRSVARSFLDCQGLGALKVEDLLARELLEETALRTVANE